jgi:fibrillarin-like pre-rRNA processing protein
MKQLSISGIYKYKNKLFTENPEYCKGKKVYDEILLKYNKNEFRSWNPYKSKLSAAIFKGLVNINITDKSDILYLGAATGTTVSHLADINKNGFIYAIEKSPFALKKLLDLCNERKNIIPIMSDANQPEKYIYMVPKVDLIYQDISQRNQAEIFIKNIKKFLKINGQGIMMIKARSIDVSLEPKKIYNMIIEELKLNKINIINLIDISSYEKDHAAIIISF